MTDKRDLIEAWIGDATGLLSDALPSTFGAHIPEIIAALAPSVERLISASAGTVTADRVVVRDHRDPAVIDATRVPFRSSAGTRLAAENAEAFERR